MRKYLVCAVLILSAVLLVCTASCDKVTTEKLYRHGAVVRSDRIAGEIGLQTLKAGGNAVDAACATAMALAVSYPTAGNLGGGGFALVYSAKAGKVEFLDFRETAPASVTAAMYLDSSGKVNRDKATVGPLSAGTPGTVAGLYEMHHKYGKLPWNELVLPARYLADTGFAVSDFLAGMLLSNKSDLEKFPSTASIFFPAGKPLSSGNRLVQPDLARTLGLIEEQGRDGFYLGENAQKIAAFSASTGGTITENDLRDYQPKWREPIHFQFQKLDIYAPGLPSSGGVVMAEIMKTLALFDLSRFEPKSPGYMHLFVEAARRAYADREEYLGDPGFVRDYTGQLLDDSYIATRARSIDTTKASVSEEIQPGIAKDHPEPTQTTHLVVSDADGNIVSLTYTLNLEFGSKAVVPDAGFFLNNEMDDFAIAPGQANAFGLAGGQPNVIAPGKRMLSSMSPTIILKNNRPYLALGSPGGSKIITAVAQTILNYAVFGMPISRAVAAPRFHHQWMPDAVYVEKGGYEPKVLTNLIGKGHTVEERAPYCEVMALQFSMDGLYATGAADPRGPGCVLGY